MKKLDKPTGFIAQKDRITVLDANGRPFYSHIHPDGKRLKFNLPAGSYQFQDDAKELPGIIPFYREIKKPAPDKLKRLGKYTVLFARDTQGTPGYIDHKKKQIVLNYNLKKDPARLNFVFFHELGHRLYNDETKCDIYAARQMLKQGFNPSQILDASDSLSRDPARIEAIFQKFTNF